MSGAKTASIGLPLLAFVFLLVGYLARPPQEEFQPPPPQEYKPDLAAAYVKAQCWQCHSISTLDSRLTADFGAQAAGVRPFGPDLAGVGNRYAADWHRAHFWQPDMVVAGSQMPAQRQLFKPGEPPELNPMGEDVLRFMLSLTTPSQFNRQWPTGRYVAPVGDADSGRKLFIRECAGCHGREGHGDGPAAAFFRVARAPAKLADGELIYLRKDEAPVDTIYIIITNGLPRTGMPGFDERLTDRERADLAAYVLKISKGTGSVSPGKD